MSGSPFRMSGSGRESLPDVRGGWEALPDVREWSGVSPGCPGWSGGPPGCPGVVGWPSRLSGSGRKTLLVVWEWWEALPEVLEA